MLSRVKTGVDGLTGLPCRLPIVHCSRPLSVDSVATLSRSVKSSRKLLTSHHLLWCIGAISVGGPSTRQISVSFRRFRMQTFSPSDIQNCVFFVDGTETLTKIKQRK